MLNDFYRNANEWFFWNQNKTICWLIVTSNEIINWFTSSVVATNITLDVALFTTNLPLCTNVCAVWQVSDIYYSICFFHFILQLLLGTYYIEKSDYIQFRNHLENYSRTQQDLYKIKFIEKLQVRIDSQEFFFFFHLICKVSKRNEN